MIITNAQIIYKDKIENGSVQIRDGKIVAVNPEYIASGHPIMANPAFSQGINYEEIIDAQGLYLSPGFIDIHIHGAGGKDVMEGTKEAIEVIGMSIAKHGTTSFCPTTMTMDVQSIRNVLQTIKDLKNQSVKGAHVLGVHLEGPCINPGKLGAQNPRYVLDASISNFHRMIEGYEELITTITLAPEMITEEETISYLNQYGIHVSMGHTKASYEEAVAAIESGVAHATHLYNAMTPFGHRNPGVVGAVFDSDITTEFIADGIHIDYPALRIALKQKGTDRICLITDAMMGCTMPEGIYDLGGQKVYLKDGMAKLKDGTFAGTLLTLDEAVRNLKNHTEYPLYEIVKMATYNPAKYCGVEDRKGLIKPGYDADLLLFDDNVHIDKVMINGNIID